VKTWSGSRGGAPRCPTRGSETAGRSTRRSRPALSQCPPRQSPHLAAVAVAPRGLINQGYCCVWACSTKTRQMILYVGVQST
jgi:hypothetical protein